MVKIEAKLGRLPHVEPTTLLASKVGFVAQILPSCFELFVIQRP
jgi:hypothetical protein